MKIQMQDDIKDCGLYVLQSFYNFFWKKSININQLKYLADYSKDGISISNLVRISKQININLEPYEVQFQELTTSNITLPCISLIKIDGFLHYIIIYKIKKNIVEILDPVNGKRKISIETFEKLFSNIVIFASKIENKDVGTHLKNKNVSMNLTKKIIFIIVLLNSLSVLFNYFLSFINKNVFVYIQQQNQLNSLKQVIFLLWISLLILLLNFFNNLMILISKSFVIKNIKSRFINRLKNAEIKQLDKITKNDILMRYLSINNIAVYLTNTISFWPTIILSFSLIIPLFFYTKFEYIALIITINLIKILIGIFLNYKIYQMSRKSIQNNLNEINDLTFLAKNINNYEITFWNSYYSDNFLNLLQQNQLNDQKLSKTIIYKSCLFNLLNILTNFIIFLIFINLKETDISQIIFILQIQNMINEPTNILQQVLIEKKINKVTLEKLNFILNVPNKNDKNEIYIYSLELNKILVNNLTFSYSNKLIFSNLNLTIENSLKIIGDNGCGKTTFLKLLSRKIKDEADSIFFNNFSLKNIDDNWLNNNIYFTDKNFEVPSCDLYTFLFFDVGENERNKLLHNNNFIYLLKLLNLDLFSNIALNKNSFSAGQQQILKLLPLIVKKYQLILLDEAFEFLSKPTFKLIKKLILEKQEKSIFIETSYSSRFLIKNADVFNIEKAV
ncbi:Mbov_0121 family peptidase domain-containing ABC transporter [Metamycoplasma gateae]|uniref:Cysteine peptidase family C39 domain-containing protein n=1 Tax=Metamycoplasma gateae TaxID=35769 RepID=A0ABZ2AGS5_9BACT|nr:cysteine peptidase family C39 domain-containing protein [Metamycoplasma gateae]